MASQRTKSFSISEPSDLEKVDSWWAGLLRNGPKEIQETAWEAKGDLNWTLKATWEAVDKENMPFNVCMPAYSGLSVDDLKDILDSYNLEKKLLSKNLKLLKIKIDEWGIVENDPEDLGAGSDDYMLSDFSIDPTLSYGAKLDTVEKVMASEFLWPSYKSMTQALLMTKARLHEIVTEIKNRNNPDYTVVHVDRGMLRKSFRVQIGYDNKWLFATDEEIFEDYEEG